MRQSFDIQHVPIESEQVVDLSGGVRGEELLVVQQRKCQTLEALEKEFDVLFTVGLVGPVPNDPVEYVLPHSNFIVFHGLVVDPDPGFDEVDFQLVGLLELDGEPGVGERVDLVDKLEHGALLQKFVADGVLNCGQDREEVNFADLEVSQCIPETVGQPGLQLEKGLNGNLVDFLETLAVDI